jgi:hypothetical protein
MKTNTLTWKLYKLIFLDLWHHQFFHSEMKPQQVAFSDQELASYLSELNIKIEGKDGQKSVDFKEDQPLTLFYADHPSSLDALFIFAFLKKVDPIFVSFLHNVLHFAFLEKRMIPVAAYFKAKQWNLLGMKMKFARSIENLSEKEAQAINKKVVPSVLETLDKGRSVIIFPSGGWGKWQDGIGFVVDKYYQKNPQGKLTLQPLKIKSFREIHSVCHSLCHWLGIRVKGKITIAVGEQYQLPDFAKKHSEIFLITDKKQRAKAIRAYLEEAYRKL